MSWVWLNIPLGVLVVLAIAGIPMWLVLKHPDARPELTGAARPDVTDSLQRSRARCRGADSDTGRDAVTR
jgi:hypothetical protein